MKSARGEHLHDVHLQAGEGEKVFEVEEEIRTSRLPLGM